MSTELVAVDKIGAVPPGHMTADDDPGPGQVTDPVPGLPCTKTKVRFAGPPGGVKVSTAFCVLRVSLCLLLMLQSIFFDAPELPLSNSLK